MRSVSGATCPPRVSASMRTPHLRCKGRKSMTLRAAFLNEHKPRTTHGEKGAQTGCHFYHGRPIGALMFGFYVTWAQLSEGGYVAWT